MALSQIILELLKGLGVSVEIFAITLLFSLPLGLLVAFGRMSKNGVVSGLTKAYISIMRGTPLMLQLFVVYYGPYYLCHIKLSPTYRNSAVYIGFIINYAAYFAEIYRSGIQSMPVGQYEAADILGYSRVQSFFRIILPQVMKRILPSITNEVITLVKDTSLARIISYQEVIWAGYAFLKGSHGYSGLIWPLFFTGIYYLIFNGVVSFLLGRLERKLEFFR